VEHYLVEAVRHMFLELELYLRHFGELLSCDVGFVIGIDFDQGLRL